jgi:Domain of unknown function (DUF4260)
MSRSPETRIGVSGWPAILLRLEGAALLAAASFAYARLGGEWRWFAYLFFAPDLSFLAYLAGPRVGAVAYNGAHTTIVPLIVGALGVVLKEPFMTQIAAIHLAHIGFDRALGYGLKYGTAFADTHLGRIGRKT